MSSVRIAKDYRLIVVGALALSLVCGQSATALAQPGPVVERIEPASGPPGSAVQLVGRHFDRATRAFIGAVELSVIRRLPGRLTVELPPGTQSGEIIVRSRRGAYRGPYFRVTEARPGPSIHGIAPNAGAPGMEVTIHGRDFSQRLADNVVRLGGVRAVVRSASPTTLVVIVPTGATSGPFSLQVEHTAAIESPHFEVTAGTAIVDFEPRIGPPGAHVIIRGTGFSPRRLHNRVFMNNRPVNVVQASPTELIVVIPPNAAAGTLLLDVRDGGRAETPEPFRIQHLPSLTSFEPALGIPGQAVTLHGNHFGRDPRAVIVTLAGRPVRLRSVAPRSLVVDVPEGAQNGPFEVTVHGVGPVRSRGTFRVLIPVQIIGFRPTAGSVGTVVTIEGRGFSPDRHGNLVTLAGTAAEVLSTSPGALIVRVPATSSGTFMVRVPDNGEARTTRPFVVTQPPVVDAVEPSHGTPGSTVTIRGRNFGVNPTVLRVRIGQISMQILSVNDSQIVAVIPPDAVTDQISVAVRLQGTALSPNQFRVQSNFSVASVDAASVYHGGTLRLLGQGFEPGTRLRFAGVRRRVPVEFVSPGEVRATVPRRARTGAVVVRLPDGREASIQITIAAPPEGVAIEQIDASCYRPGCVVVVRGHGFSAQPMQNRVFFGDSPVRVQSSTATDLTLTLPRSPGTASFRVDVRRVGVATSAPFTIVP